MQPLLLIVDLDLLSPLGSCTVHHHLKLSFSKQTHYIHSTASYEWHTPFTQSPTPAALSATMSMSVRSYTTRTVALLYLQWFPLCLPHSKHSVNGFAKWVNK